MMEEKAQTSIEMLLLLAGVIVVVLIVAVLIKNAVNEQAATGQQAITTAGEQFAE
jgi:uncharacterized protein (UPF0333 family)